MEQSIKIFFSYAHEDEDLRQEIEKCLEALRRQGQITTWHDCVIGAGTEWKRAIEYHLNTSDIILLLVSRDFIASEFCYSFEVKRAMERHEAGEARVIPIILRPTHWQLTPFGKLQALPTGGVPIVDRKWGRVDYALFDIEKGLRQVVNECRSSLQTYSSQQGPGTTEQVNQYKGFQPPSTGSWPTPQEYDIAIKEYVNITEDKDLQIGRLFMDRTDSPLIFNGGGARFVRVYRVGDWVVRCFTEYAPEDMRERYLAISAYVRQNLGTNPFLVPHIWIDPGIFISGKIWPLVKVPYIRESVSLGDFVAEHHNEHLTMKLLAEKWLRMINQLEQIQVAHGDLDTTNVLVRKIPSDLSIYLIDYDGMYVPNLAGYKAIDLGHGNFQYPSVSTVRHFNAHMDRFSALVIYLSLVALAEDSRLYGKCDASEYRLLLGEHDFKHLSLSKNFALLRRNTDNIALQKCLDELEGSLVTLNMPSSLSKVLAT